MKEVMLPSIAGTGAVMRQTRFAARLARYLGRHVEAACPVRPPGATLVVGICAGAGAGIGSLLGGLALGGWAILAGIGGGLGALVGYLVIWLRSRGRDQAVSMALVLQHDRVELLRLRPLGTKPAATLRSIPYPHIDSVTASDRMLGHLR